ncbi:hypothetical protein NA655_04250 [Pseudomonas kuykendallii]|uniref:Uncharacterized protein n=1 Tax=Pseudomonas kuykendallii TaxID=1007099 RepID=A0A1H3DM20_9PSED|nr:hypothetical protein [Pseudomonas kuykendallii]MCQ4270230.1 hypothetical protein [Pseudomonas kuykendallii]SDX67421.1 hypothetical protein SAMN05216287_3479 [Pseudomonas kuykendallii]
MTEEAHTIDPRIAEHTPYIAALADKHPLLINLVKRMLDSSNYFRDSDYHEARGYLTALMWSDAIPAGPCYFDQYMAPLRALYQVATEDMGQRP